MAVGRSARDAREEVLLALVDALEQMIIEGERFTDISVERLARAAKMSRTRFYRHFCDKNDLLREWLLARQDTLAGTAERIWNLGSDANPAALSEIERELHAAYGPQVALMTAVYDAAATDAELRADLDAIMAGRIERLHRHIELGQSEGWIDPSLLAAETAAWLVWMAEWGNHQIALKLPGFDPPPGSLGAVFWRVLYAPVDRTAPADVSRMAS